MNRKTLEEGITLLREGVEANVRLLLDVNDENRQEAEIAKKAFEDWCEQNPAEFQYMDENFVG